MGSNIDIIGPATIALLGGTSLNSLDSLPPDGLTLTDSDAPTAVAVTLATSGASLSASSAGGASIASNGGTLTISGSLGAVNAALASLEISGTGGTLSIAASDNVGATSTTTLALAEYSNPPLAFVAPPGTFSVPLGEPNPLSGLTLAADGAAALALLGAAAEAMNLTLISSNGPLLLDPASAPGIAISGDATGTLVLGFASSQLAAVNAALGAIDLVAGGNGTLEYIARELSGPLAGTVTSGSFTYSSGSTASSGSESWSGGSGSWQAGGNWSGGFAPNGGTGITISGTEVIGGIGVASALTLSGANVSLSADVAATGSLAVTGSTLDLEGSIGAPAALSAASADISGSNVLIENAALSVQGDLTFGTQASMLVGAAGTLDAGTYSLGGGDSLLEFGSLGGDVLAVGASAAALLPGGGALGDFVSVGGGGIVDFAGMLEGGATAVTANPLGFTLASGGIIEGAGTLVAGDFSEAGVIDGPGTILALGPAPLTIAAGSIGGGAQLVIDPGAVLELGAVSPLYGVFDPTPLTLDSSVTVSFAPGASAAQDQGSYASAPGEQGGVLVLDYPADFAGTITNFTPGDRIVLPQLADLSISNLTGHSFVVSGIDPSGISESDTIHASYASGLSPAVETDAAGDQVIGLRATTAQLTLNDTPATQAMIDAVSGYAETIGGLGLLLPSAGSTALSLTISALSGLLGDGAGQASTLTLAGSSGLALNDLLDHLSYTPQSGGSGDTLRFAGGGGALTGFSANVAVSIAAPATLSWQGGSGSFGNGAAWSGGNAPANGDVAVFGSHAGAPDIVTGPAEAGAITIAGGYDFAGSFIATGLGGAALSIDHQAVALFDANAAVSLGGSMLIGDAGGAGTLGIAGSLAAQSVDVAGNANATGSLLDVSGSLASAGAMQVGASAAGTLDLSGNLSAGQVTIGTSGVLRGVGAATAGLGALDLEGGTLALSGGASASAGNGMVNGGTILLAGQSSLAIGQTLTMAAGTLSVGAEAALYAGAGGSIAAGSVLDDSGMITIGGLILGGTVNLAGQSSLVSGGAVTLTAGASLSMTGAMLTASSLAIASGATLSGFGDIGGTGSGMLPAIAADGALTASGGTLTLGGNLTGNVTIGAGAAVDLVHGASGGTISFTGAGETLIINDVAAMQDVVSGMVAGDAIELIGIVPGEVGIANGMVNIADPSSFGFSPAASQPAPQVASNGSGGSTITMGGEMPCFARGTRLLTPSGYRPVEVLSPGDPLVTQGGVARGIVWIGSRVIDLATDPAAHLLRPVVIAAGAFGPGLPLRPLRLSPLHAVFIDGALVPAALLVNGATITRDDRIQAVTYYHVELARHEVVRAEGLAVESYRDTGNRHRFAEGRGRPCGMLPACAPMLTRGDGLARVRQALHERALAFGYRMIHRPELHLWTRGQRIEPRLRGGRACFALPDGPSLVELRARSAAPAETDPASEDRRELGVCVGVIRADGRSIAWRGEGDGWHPRAMGDRGCWTGGRAVLELPRRPRRLSLDLVGAVRLWQAPSI